MMLVTSFLIPLLFAKKRRNKQDFRLWLCLADARQVSDLPEDLI